MKQEVSRMFMGHEDCRLPASAEDEEADKSKGL